MRLSQRSVKAMEKQTRCDTTVDKWWDNEKLSRGEGKSWAKWEEFEFNKIMTTIQE